MADKKITDVTYTSELTSNDSIFINQDNHLKQINKNDLFLPPQNKILWEGSHYMNATQTIDLSEPISAQEHGVILVWSAYADNTPQNYNWNYFFIPKFHVLYHNGNGIECLCGHATTIISKYVYVSDTQIQGNERNSNASFSLNGYTVNNQLAVLRYVIGV